MTQLTKIIDRHGEAVISDDLDKTMSKSSFVSELINELLSFALLNINIEIQLKDCEENEILFSTRR
jgi:hypothetical protein